MANDVNMNLLFKLPPEKVIAYLQAKGYRVNKDWEKLLEKSREDAFYITGVMKEDIVKDAKSIIDRGITEGKTFNSIKKEFQDRMQAKGWEESTFRLKTIYRVNSDIAYSVGRYQEQIDIADFAPIWVYEAVMDANTREEHAMLNGLAFPVDDPFWDYFYPPNGYNCRCEVRAMTEERFDRKDIPLLNSENKIKETKDDSGEPTHSYRGIKVDSGWDKNFGKNFIKGKFNV